MPKTLSTNLHTPPGCYVAVVGGVNMDICGQSYKPLIARDSNPGFIRTTLGGVGRNIAHNLALLGVEVSFLTVLGDDDYADMVEKSCANLGISLEASERIPGEKTSTYLFLNGPDGDMALAVSDMAIYENILPDWLEERREFLDNAQAVVLDTNIPEESIRWITENCTRPIFVDPVSAKKAEKLRSCLSSIHTLKPNRLEAEQLSGIQITDEKSLNEAAKILLQTGLQRVFITMGSEGIFCASRQETASILPVKVTPKNTNGAGDAFMAGIVWAYLQGCGLRESAELASAASAISIEGTKTINPALSIQNLKQMLDR